MHNLCRARHNRTPCCESGVCVCFTLEEAIIKMSGGIHLPNLLFLRHHRAETKRRKIIIFVVGETRNEDGSEDKKDHGKKNLFASRPMKQARHLRKVQFSATPLPRPPTTKKKNTIAHKLIPPRATFVDGGGYAHKRRLNFRPPPLPLPP